MTATSRRGRLSRIKAAVARGEVLAPANVRWLAQYNAWQQTPAETPRFVPSPQAAYAESPHVYTTDPNPPIMGTATAEAPDGVSDAIGQDPPDETRSPPGPEAWQSVPPNSAPPPPQQSQQPQGEPPPPNPLAVVVATVCNLLFKRALDYDIVPGLREEIPELGEDSIQEYAGVAYQGYCAGSLRVWTRMLEGVSIPYAEEGMVIGGAGWGGYALIRQRAARKEAEEAARKRAEFGDVETQVATAPPAAGRATRYNPNTRLWAVPADPVAEASQPAERRAATPAATAAPAVPRTRAPAAELFRTRSDV